MTTKDRPFATARAMRGHAVPLRSLGFVLDFGSVPTSVTALLASHIFVDLKLFESLSKWQDSTDGHQRVTTCSDGGLCLVGRGVCCATRLSQMAGCG